MCGKRDFLKFDALGIVRLIAVKCDVKYLYYYNQVIRNVNIRFYFLCELTVFYSIAV